MGPARVRRYRRSADRTIITLTPSVGGYPDAAAVSAAPTRRTLNHAVEQPDARPHLVRPAAVRPKPMRFNGIGHQGPVLPAPRHRARGQRDATAEAHVVVVDVARSRRWPLRPGRAATQAMGSQHPIRRHHAVVPQRGHQADARAPLGEPAADASGLHILARAATSMVAARVDIAIVARPARRESDTTVARATRVPRPGFNTTPGTRAGSAAVDRRGSSRSRAAGTCGRSSSCRTSRGRGSPD